MEYNLENLNQFFWSLTVFIIFTCAFVFLYYSLKKEEKNERLLMIGFSSVSFGLAFNQFFWLLKQILTPFENTLDLIAILSYTIGLALFFLIFDTLMKKTKFLPFIINLILIPLIIIFHNVDLYVHPRLFVYISYIFNATTFCFILLWFSMKSGEEFKLIAIFLMTGAIVYLIGAVLQSTFIVDVISYSPIISYTLLVTGAVLFVSPVFFKRKKKSQIKTALIIGSISYIISLFIASYFIINLFLSYNVHYLFIIASAIMIFGASIILLHFILNIGKLSKTSELINIEKELKTKKDILSVFSRRDLITEEEISISKEKRICLVCKKDLQRDIYICPNCYAFYCKNCSTILTNRENACWVCNSPFDPSKPTKIVEQGVIENVNDKKMKKIGTITIIDLEFFEKVEKFKWDEEEKKEFLKSMLALSPIERMNIINEMLEMTEALNKGETYFEEDF